VKELYVAASAAVAREKHLAIVANNLANVNSIGFKRDAAVFQVRPPEMDVATLEATTDEGLRLPHPTQQIEGDRNYVRMAANYTDHSNGALRLTGSPLDVGLDTIGSGPGAPFFAIETPQGTAYTRMGNFHLNLDKELVTVDGQRVLSPAGGAIKLEDANVSIDEAGGILDSEGKNIGAIQIQVFQKPELLGKTGHGLFADTTGQAGGAAPEAADGVRVRQGYLEGANVNIVEELVRMIEIQRAFSTYQKSIQTMDDASSQVIRSAMNG